MKTHFIYIPLLLLTMLECNTQPKQLKADVFETSAEGNKLKKRTDFSFTLEKTTPIIKGESGNAVVVLHGANYEVNITYNELIRKQSNL